MISAPLDGWRHVKVTDRRGNVDFAHVMRDIADIHFPDKKIVLVMDNLNTHDTGSLYEAFGRPRPIALPNGSKSTTRPSMAAG